MLKYSQNADRIKQRTSLKVTKPELSTIPRVLKTLRAEST